MLLVAWVRAGADVFQPICPARLLYGLKRIKCSHALRINQLHLIHTMGRPPLDVLKSLPVSVRLPPDVKAAAEATAREDMRSLSSFIEKLLTDHLRKKGLLKK
jgi:hypothetical protein